MPTIEGAADLRRGLTETLDAYPGLERSIPISPVYGHNVLLFAETGASIHARCWAGGRTPTTTSCAVSCPTTRSTRARYVDGSGSGRHCTCSSGTRGSRATSSRQAVCAGVGSRDQLPGLGYYWELWTMAATGMKAHEALRMATTMRADAIGLGTDVGSLESGKLADLVVLTGNPAGRPSEHQDRRARDAERLVLPWRDPRRGVSARAPSTPLSSWDEEPDSVPDPGPLSASALGVRERHQVSASAPHHGRSARSRQSGFGHRGGGQQQTTGYPASPCRPGRRMHRRSPMRRALFATGCQARNFLPRHPWAVREPSVVPSGTAHALRSATCNRLWPPQAVAAPA